MEFVFLFLKRKAEIVRETNSFLGHTNRKRCICSDPYYNRCTECNCLYCHRNSILERRVATGYRLDGPGIESRWGRDFPHLSRPVLGPTQPPVQWVPVLSRGKERPRRDTDPSPPSSAMAVRPVEPQCLYKGALYLF
jgi:hypothetical protein